MTRTQRLLLVSPLVLYAACATAPSPRPAPQVAEPLPTVARKARRMPTAAAGHATGGLNEGAIGEAPGLTPAPELHAAVPGPTPPAGGPAAATAAEPESLLARIGPSTPPNVAAALRLIEDGRQHMSGGHYDKALERFERSVAIDPTNAYGYYFLAQLHFHTKKYDQAVAFASRAAILSARNDPVCLGRAYGLEGAAFEAVGRYADARAAYEKAVQADPNNLAARTGVARLTPIGN
jgi:tetratricopeptide (TPR) repeat protein